MRFTDEGVFCILLSVFTVCQNRPGGARAFPIRFVRLFKPEELSKSQVEWTYKIFFTTL